MHFCLNTKQNKNKPMKELLSVSTQETETTVEPNFVQSCEEIFCQPEETFYVFSSSQS